MKSPLVHVILACTVCAIAIIGYGIWFAVIEAKSSAVANLESQIVLKTAATNRVAFARATLSEITGDEANIRSYFVPETGVVAFINNLEAQGRTQGATVSVLSVATAGAATQPTLSFALTIKGTFDSVMRTVGAIEYAPYSLSISTLSINQDGKNSWHANLNLAVGSVPKSVATSTP